MSVRPVVLLARRDGNRQAILFWRERTSSIRGHRAGRTVGSVKVDHDGPIHDRIGVKKAASGICIRFTGQVAEDERQALRRMASEIGELDLLAIDLKHRRPTNRGWRGVT